MGAKLLPRVAGLGSGHTVFPSAALTVPESTRRLSRELWHLPGATRHPAAGRLVTHHLGSGPGMIISVVTTASCRRPHRLRADHCLLTPGTFGLKLIQPAGIFAQTPVPSAAGRCASTEEGTGLEPALVSPSLVQITVPENALLPLCHLRFQALLAGMQRGGLLGDGARDAGSCGQSPRAPAGSTAGGRVCLSSSHEGVQTSPLY